ncbi:bacterial proteasome activator family protein [soil metagenome]
MVEQVEVVPDDERTNSDGAPDDTDVPEPMITEPGKLMRIAVMLREVQEEARRADADEAGRGRLRQVHERALSELCGILSDDLQEELGQFTFDFDAQTPSQSEIMIAQAQLIGWLEGLFQGIQAAIFNQQASARKQLETMRQRGLPMGAPAEGQGQGERPGQYL